jgi:hypothetical protein
MTTLSMRYLRGDFVVTGPHIEPVRFKTRREAWVWCFQHHPGSPVKVAGADATKRASRAWSFSPPHARCGLNAIK